MDKQCAETRQRGPLPYNFRSRGPPGDRRRPTLFARSKEGRRRSRTRRPRAAPAATAHRGTGTGCRWRCMLHPNAAGARPGRCVTSRPRRTCPSGVERAAQHRAVSAHRAPARAAARAGKFPGQRHRRQRLERSRAVCDGPARHRVAAVRLRSAAPARGRNARRGACMFGGERFPFLILADHRQARQQHGLDDEAVVVIPVQLRPVAVGAVADVPALVVVESGGQARGVVLLRRRAATPPRWWRRTAPSCWPPAGTCASRATPPRGCRARGRRAFPRVRAARAAPPARGTPRPRAAAGPRKSSCGRARRGRWRRRWTCARVRRSARAGVPRRRCRRPSSSQGAMPMSSRPKGFEIGRNARGATAPGAGSTGIAAFRRRADRFSSTGAASRSAKRSHSRRSSVITERYFTGTRAGRSRG